MKTGGLKFVQIYRLRWPIVPEKSQPECKLWFFDGKDSKNRTVSNPTIGYGFHTKKYADGNSREFFRIGVSGNKTGISVYILGLKDKKLLSQNVWTKTRQGERERIFGLKP